MSNEQSIRDEIAQVAVNVVAPTSQAWLAFQGGENHREYVRRIADAVMPLIRRIQAEAWDAGFDEASDDLGRAQMMRDLGESNNPYLEGETA